LGKKVTKSVSAIYAEKFRASFHLIERVEDGARYALANIAEVLAGVSSKDALFTYEQPSHV